MYFSPSLSHPSHSDSRTYELTHSLTQSLSLEFTILLALTHIFTPSLPPSLPSVTQSPPYSLPHSFTRHSSFLLYTWTQQLITSLTHSIFVTFLLALTHVFTPSLPPSLTHCPPYSLPHSFTRSDSFLHSLGGHFFTHSPFLSLTHSLTHSPGHQFTHPLHDSLLYTLTCPFHFQISLSHLITPHLIHCYTSNFVPTLKSSHHHMQYNTEKKCFAVRPHHGSLGTG